jgi:double-stranded RNA-binding protein Staufen
MNGGPAHGQAGPGPVHQPPHLTQMQPGMAVGPTPGMQAPQMAPQQQTVTSILQPPIPHSHHNATVVAAGPTMVSVAPSAADHHHHDTVSAGDHIHDLANTKEKTPMCLINELARYNKIQHQYTLTDEQGPAHKKTFYVKLKLGDEDYAADGPSIKKAQHAAAAIALAKTQYKHPPPKPPRSNQDGQWGMTDDQCFDGENPNITPTVELNALAMKRGEPAVYRSIEPQRPYYPPPNYDFRGMYNQRYHYPRYARIFYVSLKVGQREFIGEGNTRQSARHSAAAKALKILRVLPMPNDDGLVRSVVPITVTPSDGDEQDMMPPGITILQRPDQGGDGGEMYSSGAGGDMYSPEDDGDDALKSEISLVHEIALKRNLPVNFEVIRESGPPHMRTFITRCTVGDFVTDGEGNGKKVSKKRSAEKMLDQLRTLHPLPPSIARPKRTTVSKKKSKNLIKVSFQLQKADPNYGVGINPISRLIQIQQAKKEKEPIYTLITERGMPRRREFVMQVQVGDQTCTGVGPNKKLAKRNAAEAMLQLLGYSRPSPQPVKPAMKSADGQGAAGNDKKVTFIDHHQHQQENTNLNRQVVPGILLTGNFMSNQGNNMGRGQYGGNLSGNFSSTTTAAIAQELLDTGSSPTAEALSKGKPQPPPMRPENQNAKQQLLYLAEILGFQVQFTDFPKGTNKNEYLSLVSLSTNPPQVSHGAGATIEASHDIAAVTALKGLADMGLDCVSDNTRSDERMASGDGPHIKKEPVDTLANSADLGNMTSIKTEAM